VTPDLLREAGEALYGARWQSDLARDLGVSDRTVRRWAAGSFAVPAGVWGLIHNLLRERGVAMANVRRRLKRAA